MEDKITFQKIQQGDVKAFELLFHQYYGMLCHLAGKILHSPEVAEDIVQEVFSRLWIEREQIRIEISVKAFLSQWVKNKCFNYLKHLQVINLYQNEQMVSAQEIESFKEDPKEEMLASIFAGIQMLPPQCKRVFKLSRFKGMKHSEIADKLGISVKTVKIHIGKALLLIKQSVEKNKK